MLNRLTTAVPSGMSFLVQSARPKFMMMMQPAEKFGFASRMKSKRIYVDKTRILLPKNGRGDESVLNFRPLSTTKGVRNPSLIKMNVKSVTRRATVKRQATPLHDYINFKGMSGNEILINLNNVENLGQQEMMAGLLELSRRDKGHKHDWNTNPITAKCIRTYVDKARGYNAKRTIQGAMMLHMLRIRSPKAW